jgi:hypothetical protein
MIRPVKAPRSAALAARSLSSCCRLVPTCSARAYSTSRMSASSSGSWSEAMNSSTSSSSLSRRRAAYSSTSATQVIDYRPLDRMICGILSRTSLPRAKPRPPAVFVSLRCQLFTLLASPTNSDAAADPSQSSILGDDLAAAGWAGSRITRCDLPEEIAALKGESGGEIMAHGDATFVQALSRLGLIDEYRLVILPVALGNGLPLFKDLAKPLRVDLSEAKSLSDGTVIHVYQPIKSRDNTWPICDAVFIDVACLPIRAWPLATEPTRQKQWPLRAQAGIRRHLPRSTCSPWLAYGPYDEITCNDPNKSNNMAGAAHELCSSGTRVHNNGRARICRRDRQ